MEMKTYVWELTRDAKAKQEKHEKIVALLDALEQLVGYEVESANIYGTYLCGKPIPEPIQDPVSLD